MLRRLGALLAALGAALILLVAGAGSAAAHATLISTDPSQNAVVPTAPAAVTLTFSEGVSLAPDSVRVLGPDGKAVDQGNPGHADGKADTARVQLNSGLANGTYTVAWRAVSEDSHPVGGAFTFSIGAPSATTVSAAAVDTGGKADPLVAFAYGTGRVIAYLAFALLAGAAAFVLICWPRGAGVVRVQRLLMAGWVALLVATVAVLLLRGPYERGTGIGQALDLSLVRTTLEERIGTALSARLLLLAAGGVFLSLLVGQLGGAQPATEPNGTDRTDGTADEAGDGTSDGSARGRGARDGGAGRPAPGVGSGEASGRAVEEAEEAELRKLEQRAAERPLREARLGLGVAGLVLAIALSATWVGADHASVGIQVALALPLGALHLLAMALWLGGLVTVLVGLRHGLETAAVQLFSKLAFWSVVVLVVTGVYQSWRGVGSWGALTGTEYGRLLLIKTGCVVAMVGVAWFSRGWLTRLGPAEDTAATTETGTASPSVSTRTEEAGAADPARAAQLARQQAAVAKAKQRKAQDGTPARAGLRRSVLVEAGVGVAVLVVTTMLTNSPPGRVAQAVAATGNGPGPAKATSAPNVPGTVPGKSVELKLPYNTGGKTPGSKGTATVALGPAATGQNAVQVTIADESGKPVAVPEVQVAFTLPDRDLGPLPVTLQPTGTGRWSGTVQLPLAGDWVASVVVRSSDFDQDTQVKPVTIG
ncbi:ABC transporter [Kitasatospora sp. MMS16-BH015]|uniref:copper resistance CopC/CopD family protein n=1 Tax=Kitasatospora sp. MMS16-BH015 TaxID=2018025 RepID=UPI000CA1D4EC|nr:FixH family protein [Kitasatospora sp. MMS16-BH015]AUG78757.1 ABC transporter [Kitasatospora sp. MMS16-BH015]